MWRFQPACTELSKTVISYSFPYRRACGLFSADFSLAKYHGEAPHYALLNHDDGYRQGEFCTRGKYCRGERSDAVNPWESNSPPIKYHD